MMLNDILRRPIQRAAVLGVLPALLVAGWLTAQADGTDPTNPPGWDDDHHTLSKSWDDLDLGHNPIGDWFVSPDNVV